MLDTRVDSPGRGLLDSGTAPFVRGSTEVDAQLKHLLDIALRASIRRWFLTTPATVVLVMAVFWLAGALSTGAALSLAVLLIASIHAVAIRSDSFLGGRWSMPAYSAFAATTGLVSLLVMPDNLNGQIALLVTDAVSLPLTAYTFSARPNLSAVIVAISGASRALGWAFGDHSFDSEFPWAGLIGVTILCVPAVLETADQQRSLAEVSLRATHYSRIDALTGLQRRSAFMRRLDWALERFNGGSLIFVDIDRFKVINDTLGHTAGDLVLTAAAERITSELRSTEFAGRMGGDEMAIFTPETSPDGVWERADRFADAFAEEFPVMNHRVPITVSIGVASSTDTTSSGPILVHNADVAMYVSKRHGDKIQIFDETMAAEVFDREQTELALRRALRNNDICAHIQPILNVAEDRIVGFEGLGRWNRNGQVVPASSFFESAQQGNLLPSITKVVATDLIQLASSTPNPPRLGVNVEANDLGRFLDWLVEQPIDPRRFVIELTEHQITDAIHQAERQVRRAGAMGIGVMVDDFGKGYSSLSRILKLPIAGLKIDAFFIAEMAENAAARAIVVSAIHLARERDIVLIAEGVETQAQVDQLTDLGVTYMQGHHFHRPAAIAASADLIERAHRPESFGWTP